MYFGRIGTAGQTSRKEFATEAQAKTSYDKLIAEKLKKGYVEKAGTTSAEAAAPPDTKAAPEPTPVEQSPPSALSTVRAVELDPDDWLWATWRPHSPGRARAGHLTWRNASIVWPRSTELPNSSIGTGARPGSIRS